MILAIAITALANGKAESLRSLQQGKALSLVGDKWIVLAGAFQRQQADDLKTNQELTNIDTNKWDQ